MTIVSVIGASLHFGYREIMNINSDKALKLYENAKKLYPQEPK